MYTVIVSEKRVKKKKEMIEKIKKIVYDSFLGEEWDRELDFFQIWDNAEFITNCLRKKYLVNDFSEEEMDRILKLSVDLKRMELDGINFMLGRKRLLSQMKKPKVSEKNMCGNVELLFQSMKNELALAIYEKITEYHDAEWIFLQSVFLEEMTAFAWIYVCMKRNEVPEKMLPALKVIFPHSNLNRKQVDGLVKNVENFSEMLGNLWIKLADEFDRVCFMAEEQLVSKALGRRFLKREIQRQIPCNVSTLLGI